MTALIRDGIRVIRREGFLSFLIKASGHVLQRSILPLGLYHFVLPAVLQEFRNRTKRIKNLDDALDFAYSSRFFGVYINPIQVRDEIRELLMHLVRLKPRIILEIGTANGGTLFLFTRVADPEATIVSIDLPRGRFGGGYPEWKIPLYKSFILANQRIHLIRADSHNKETFEKVKTILNGKAIDFLFIDGDHTYDGVKKDFEIYSSLVKKNGVIAFHDIVVHPRETGAEVSKYWNEIKRRYKYVEIVTNWDQNWAGIGLLSK